MSQPLQPQVVNILFLTGWVLAAGFVAGRFFRWDSA